MAEGKIKRLTDKGLGFIETEASKMRTVKVKVII